MIHHDLIIQIIVLIIAGFIQGMTGFGLGLVAVGILVTFHSAKIVVPALLIIYLITNSILIYDHKEVVTKQYFYDNKIIKTLPLLFAFTGLIVGTKLLVILDTKFINLILGVILFLVSIYYMLIEFSIIQSKINIEISAIDNKLISSMITFISGLLEGFLGLGGPPIIIYMFIAKFNKKVFILTFSLFFMFINPFRFILYLYNNLYNSHVINFTIYIFTFILIGLIIGIITRKKVVTDKSFNRIVLFFLMIIGLNLIRSNIFI